MNVFSAFNGIGCASYCLEKLGIPVEKYYASEIDPQANKIATKNYPKTIHFGDITKIKAHHFLDKIDFICGGSPCQDLSIAGKMAGLAGKRSGLFYEFIRLKNELQPTWFFLENVRMKKSEQDKISALLGCEPIYFDSALVSAQTRKRLYWTNLVSKEDFIYQEDKGIVLNDILQYDILDRLKGKELEYLKNKGKYNLDKRFISIDADKALCIRARDYANWKGNYVTCGKGHLSKQDGKTYALDTICSTMVEYDDTYRKLTCIEVERCFSLPDNYTKGISNFARYRCLGNGWECATVMEFFNHLHKNQTGRS